MPLGINSQCSPLYPLKHSQVKPPHDPNSPHLLWFPQDTALKMIPSANMAHVNAAIFCGVNLHWHAPSWFGGFFRGGSGGAGEEFVLRVARMTPGVGAAKSSILNTKFLVF